MTDDKANLRRGIRFNFSLRTLALSSLLMGSCATLWHRFEPWILERTLQGHTYGVWSALFSPDGKTIVTGGGDNAVRIWDAQTGQQLRVLDDGKGHIQSVAFSADGQRLATACSDGVARIYSVPDYSLLHELPDAEKGYSVSTIAFSPDGHSVVTAEWSGFVVIWDADNAKQLRRFEHGGNLSMANFSPDGRNVISSSHWNSAKVWNSETGSIKNEIKRNRPVLCAIFSPNGKQIAIGDKDGIASIFTLKGDKILELVGHKHPVQSVSYSPDGQRIATAGWDGTARVWDAGTGRLLATMKLKFEPDTTNYAYSATFSPNSSQMVVASGAHDVFVFKRRRPEYWWGIAWLPEFWLTVTFALALVWSAWRGRENDKV